MHLLHEYLNTSSVSSVLLYTYRLRYTPKLGIQKSTQTLFSYS